MQNSVLNVVIYNWPFFAKTKMLFNKMNLCSEQENSVGNEFLALNIPEKRINRYFF